VITATVVGLAALTSKLKSATRLVRGGAQKRLDRTADRLVQTIRANAPVDSGALRDSVRAEPLRREPGVRIAAGGTPETMKPIADGTEFDEAKGTEYGTSRQAAHPFFWSAVDSYEGEFEKAVGEGADDALKEL
jgi:HK97 gp10 family phage protein